jgi:hypothetical protein
MKRDRVPGHAVARKVEPNLHQTLWPSRRGAESPFLSGFFGEAPEISACTASIRGDA